MASNINRPLSVSVALNHAQALLKKYTSSLEGKTKRYALNL